MLTHDKKALVQLSLHGASQIPKNRIRPSCWRRCLMRCHNPIAVKTPICDPRPKQANQFSNRVDGWRVVSTEEPRLHGRSPLPTCAGMNSLHKTKCLGPRAVTTKHLHSGCVLSMQWEAFRRAAPRVLARQKKGLPRTPMEKKRAANSNAIRTFQELQVSHTSHADGQRRPRDAHWQERGERGRRSHRWSERIIWKKRDATRE